ncbi:hypothetical protein Q5P01_026424 [Channa striata]|uniref:Uncharacterized protein n=1 Tax=Channa striata TaxID=64152 RepID=A0AA88LKH0_CHASR|nr:hypothetical protein Q5P01_026424 [Channa striata]
MVEQYKKTSAERHTILIHQYMQQTFALRWEEMVNSAPPNAELQDRWPALFCEAQMNKKFHRITNQNLLFTFFTALDIYTPKLLELYKKRKTGFAEKMNDKKNISTARTAALAGLPLYLKEDLSEVFKTCKGSVLSQALTPLSYYYYSFGFSHQGSPQRIIRFHFTLSQRIIRFHFTLSQRIIRFHFTLSTPLSY